MLIKKIICSGAGTGCSGRVREGEGGLAR